MIEIDFSFFALMYIGAGIAVILGLWIYYDKRDRVLYERIRLRSTFHCIKCGALYTKQGAPEVSACPECGFENAKLKF
ncbi:MAG: hydrogenase nickel incorporation protein HypA [Verrucomicrobiota bacterium]